MFRKRRQAEEVPEEDLLDEEGLDQDDPEDDSAEAEDAAEDTGFDRSQGPWDVSEIDSTEGYIDLGALRLPGHQGMELRLEVDEASGRVTTVMVQVKASAVQMQVFAAPRSSGIWDEIRAEIASGVTRQHGTADDVPGTFGRELLARVPVRTPDGRTTQQAVRFTGVDGPRWFLRAVFHGAAAFRAEDAAELEELVRNVVVVRGSEAMAPRELLPLRMPNTPAPAPAESEDSRSALDPFRRGPEITEIH